MYSQKTQTSNARIIDQRYFASFRHLLGPAPSQTILAPCQESREKEGINREGIAGESKVVVVGPRETWQWGPPPFVEEEKLPQATLLCYELRPPPKCSTRHLLPLSSPSLKGLQRKRGRGETKK